MEAKRCHPFSQKKGCRWHNSDADADACDTCTSAAIKFLQIKWPWAQQEFALSLACVRSKCPFAYSFKFTWAQITSSHDLHKKTGQFISFVWQHINQCQIDLFKIKSFVQNAKIGKSRQSSADLSINRR